MVKDYTESSKEERVKDPGRIKLEVYVRVKWISSIFRAKLKMIEKLT